MLTTNDRREQRIAKLARLREQGVDPYPARVECTHTAAQAVAAFEEATDSQDVLAQVAGRLMSIRVMGKSAFAHIADGSGRLQIYLRQDIVGEDSYDLFRRQLDIGDFIEAKGRLFHTRTGEITLEVKSFRLLSKAFRSLPDKWHGLKDTETRYRQRYLDLIANQQVREIFVLRTRLISALRRFLDERGFLEVETPVLQPLYGGAAARPFTTHHNALNRTLFLRIADELYLKRLIIGGLDRVYEIGHNFRNEGISTSHNPEFTMMEIYQAYADYHDMLRLVEEMYCAVARETLSGSVITYRDHEIDLTPPWCQVTMCQAIMEHTGIDIEVHSTHKRLKAAVSEHALSVTDQPTWGRLVDELFGEYVQPTLIEPTFVLDYPVEISPLAKKKPDAPHLTERFEYFIGGLECGNAFTELNDPLDQRERFQAQMRAFQSGDQEAHPLDEDFLTALEYGMPPTGGLGLGIDRMAMIFTNQANIREVILFPQLRSKQ